MSFNGFLLAPAVAYNSVKSKSSITFIEMIVLCRVVEHLAFIISMKIFLSEVNKIESR